jgi:hypothetical protein
MSWLPSSISALKPWMTGSPIIPSYQARPKLGPHIRVGVVFPYLVVYRHVEGDDTVSIIRVLHGRRRMTRKLLRGAR